MNHILVKWGAPSRWSFRPTHPSVRSLNGSIMIGSLIGPSIIKRVRPSGRSASGQLKKCKISKWNVFILNKRISFSSFLNFYFEERLYRFVSVLASSFVAQVQSDSEKFHKFPDFASKWLTLNVLDLKLSYETGHLA